MCDPLGKNLLPLIWFTKDFEGESTSSLGIFFLGVWDLLGKNLLLPYWGCFGEESSASLLRICFNVLGSIGEDSSASSIGMMLDMPELLRKSLLLPPWGRYLIGLILLRKNLLLSYCVRCLICLKY